ncbi:MAG: anti-sigma factor [Planctomycetia bacterium]|nr:anti-sigma factor [Planctomycetia bacterium]
MAEAFDHFLVEFAKSPSQAEAVLSTMYEGQPVTATKAERLLNYRPAIYRGLPPDYSLNSAYVMKMPCCTCFQANLASNDGGGIAVFEHNGEQDEWFGVRPSTEVLCRGMPTRLVQIDSYLAASCPCGPRYLTIVGAKNVEEVERLLAFWIPEHGP